MCSITCKVTDIGEKFPGQLHVGDYGECMHQSSAASLAHQQLILTPRQGWVSVMTRCRLLGSKVSPMPVANFYVTLSALLLTAF